MSKPSRRDRQQRGKSGAKTTSGKTGTMVSPLNGATCPTGAHPGNTGGKPGRSGRPPALVRQACRDGFDARIPTLEAIADGAAPLTETCPKCGHRGKTTLAPVIEIADRLSAIDKLGKYGLGERGNAIDRDSVEESLRQQRRIIREALPKEQASELLARIAAVWE